LEKEGEGQLEDKRNGSRREWGRGQEREGKKEWKRGRSKRAEDGKGKKGKGQVRAMEWNRERKDKAVGRKVEVEV
jgi:hypothetical protein